MAPDQTQPSEDKIEIGREIWHAAFLLRENGVNGEIGGEIWSDELKIVIACLKYAHPEYSTTEEEMEMVYNSIEPYSHNLE